jgi:hypothetical protein
MWQLSREVLRECTEHRLVVGKTDPLSLLVKKENK